MGSEGDFGYNRFEDSRIFYVKIDETHRGAVIIKGDHYYSIRYDPWNKNGRTELAPLETDDISDLLEELGCKENTKLHVSRINVKK
ncbi:MAG TPA: hypothetical protein VJI68_02570 [Candidatus Nanoarchaeia archaeon]|nr:hypothetical protein [Candidatus Nanoarchaeia archaeon]